MSRICVALVAALMIAGGCMLQAQGVGGMRESAEHRFKVEVVRRDLNHPWSVEALPGGEFLVSERRGRLWVIDADGGKREIGGLPSIAAVGQGGLLDIELARDFEATGRIFLSYSTEVTSGRYATAVARATLADGAEAEALSDRRVIFVANHVSASKLHFGSRISQLDDGTLLVSTGERGERDEAQNRATHGGALLRIDADGRAPRNNPFVGDGEYAPEIYTFGHRNVQGMAVDAQGDVFVHEHGPRGGDEVNRIFAGRNYGWPIVTYGREYRGNAQIGVRPPVLGYVTPLYHWSPSIAPSGMMIYSGKAFPQWEGNIFLGALAGKHIVRLVYEDNEVVLEEKLLTNAFGRIRDIKESSDGSIYFITDERRGGLYRIVPEGSN